MEEEEEEEEEEEDCGIFVFKRMTRDEGEEKREK